MRPPIPGSGKAPASLSTASRSAAESLRHVRTVITASARRLSTDQEATGPDAGCPEFLPPIRVRHKERAIIPLQE